MNCYYLWTSIQNNRTPYPTCNDTNRLWDYALNHPENGLPRLPALWIVIIYEHPFRIIGHLNPHAIIQTDYNWWDYALNHPENGLPRLPALWIVIIYEHPFRIIEHLNPHAIIQTDYNWQDYAFNHPENVLPSHILSLQEHIYLL